MQAPESPKQRLCSELFEKNKQAWFNVQTIQEVQWAITS